MRVVRIIIIYFSSIISTVSDNKQNKYQQQLSVISKSLHYEEQTMELDVFQRFFHPKWNAILDFTGDNPFILWTIGLNLLMVTIYWTGALFYLVLDLIDKPKWIAKYKIHPGVNEPVNMNDIVKTAKVVLFNQLVVGVVVSIIAYPLTVRRGVADTIRDVPTFNKFCLDIIVSLILNDIFFYYTHRLCHYGWLYKKYHKEHHEWTAPVALAGIYCTPTEHIFCNILSNTIGLIVMRSNLFTACLWLTHAMLRTLANHSGYKFPFYYDPRSHDYHHEKFNKYYGVLGIMDWIHKTDVEDAVKQKWN